MPGPRMGRIFLSPPAQPSREACSRRLLVGFRGPWRRIKEDDDAALRIFSVSPSALSSLSLLAPRISLPFNFFLSDFAPPPPLSSGLHCGSLLRSFQSSLDHRGRGGSPLPLPLPLQSSRFLLLPFPPPPLSPLFENFSKSSFSREFAPIHNLSSRGGKT